MSAGSRSTISSKKTSSARPATTAALIRCNLGISGNRLVFDIRLTDGTPVIAHMLSLTPFRRIVKDYFVVCDSYYAAIRTATPDRIEAIDMGRRGLHDEGSQLVMERLKHKVEIDFDTARRLFTLITVLHWKG